MSAERTIPAPVLALLRLHNTIYRRTGGWVGHRLMGAPTLLLHARGARTGTLRSSALGYWRDGEAYLIAASNGGADRHPAWYHNLRADPRAEVNVGRRRFPVTARPVVPGDAEYARLWGIVTAKNKNYGEYQAATSRPIPLLLLTPARRGEVDC